ncbi:MAG: 1,4-alpha-glucan branching protein GlgB [Magnetococcales bacterium]|nr:1,4-alpha-glucan branching protein GlgB [Magnetococcales bacterium]
MIQTDAQIEAVVTGRCNDPFAILGLHQVQTGTWWVSTFQPGALTVTVFDWRTRKVCGSLVKRHEAGFFSGPVESDEWFPYRLRVQHPQETIDVDDPYRYPHVLGDMDVHLIGEGSHLALYDVLGAHPRVLEGVSGVTFAVWAPGAQRVSVVGSFNQWDGRRHVMRYRSECGVWELFIPGLVAGEFYKYEIVGGQGELLPLKSDPMAFAMEQLPGTASIVCPEDRYVWHDDAWMAGRAALHNVPMSIYEVHLGSWKRKPEEGFRYLTYREFADDLIPYVKKMGFTHIELLPIGEHPFDGSWGYQTIGLYAPTSRFGTPEDFRYLIDRCHQEGIGILMDWVPGHFPTDPNGLGNFDGTCLYEHMDPRQGWHQDWNTLIYNYGRREVTNFLIANALYWVNRFHVDGLRVDAVASMLYLDYSRRPGEWIPNKHGGNENLEAIDFLRRLNILVYEKGHGAITIAEESTTYPMVSHPVYQGGLGFGFKWNMGWMHDTLFYMSKDSLYRRYHHECLTFGLIYAFSENFVLSLSHDEVVHGKGSLLGKMSGDRWQKFANLRCYLAFMWCYPGKKHLFMGGEIAQEREWNHDVSLDWHLLTDPFHAGVQKMVCDLNRLYKVSPPLYLRDGEPGGFEWIECHDIDQSVISFLRRGVRPDDIVVTVCNFTPVVRERYRIGVPVEGWFRELVNTDAVDYCGSGVGNDGWVQATPDPWHGRGWSVSLRLPPLATLILRPEVRSATTS